MRNLSPYVKICYGGNILNKEFLLAVLIVLTVALSVGTIYASDVNTTDSYSVSIADEISVYNSNVDNDSSNDNILKSDYSDTLSTNTDSNLLESDNNANVFESSAASSSSATIDASKSITSNDVTKYYKGSTKYTATFFDASGKALANSDVTISVNGASSTVKTDANGVASKDINLKPGTYSVVATNPITGFTLTNTFTILSTITASDITKVYADGRKFYATFLKSNGKALANKYIKFKINGKTYTKKTNSNGVAGLSLKSLKKGTYKIISYNRDGLTKTNSVKVVKSTATSLTAYTYTFLKSDKKVIKVKLLNKYGYAPSKGKIIKFKINGKTYKAKTNKNGVAKITLPSLKEGVYTVAYKFAKSGYYKASSAKSMVTIIPSKDPTYSLKSTTTFGYGANTPFKIALTSGSVPLSGKTVTLKVNGNTYTKTTDSSGVFSLPIDFAVGKYIIEYTNAADSKINSKTGATEITVQKRSVTSLKWQSSTSFYQGSQTFDVLLVDSNSKAISGETVTLTANSNTYTAKTSSTGHATFGVSLSAVGNYAVSYAYNGDNLNAPSSASTTVSVLKTTTVSIKNIAAAASNLKSYYASYGVLPNTVTASGVSYTTPEFLYLMSQAISQIGSSNLNDVAYVSGVSNPASPSGDTINSKDLTQANYLAVAKNVASYISTNKQAPNYATSAVGKIIYSEIVDSFSRILAFYNTNNRLPSYVTISYSGSTSQGGTGLNEVNTETNLAQYLASSTNCEVNNAAIKKVVDSLTSGLTSTSAKAKAIYNYVRDTLSYTFYYNTKYGAAGTLSAKKGNCVDHTHLLVAMFRTAGIPARYVHGTCTFSSGSTYGHVWAQVLIDGKWTVADATSSRNSLGSISNWNTKTFTLKGIYSSISF